MIRFLNVILILFSFAARAQISIALQGGFVSNQDKADEYALNAKWPSTNNGSYSLAMLSGGSGGAGSLTVLWEASKIFSMGLQYNLISFSSDVKRSVSSKNLGAVFKFNFVENTKRVVPYFMAGYTFYNSSTYTQEKATSTVYTSQVQAAFTGSSSTSVGFVGELGAEVKLNDSFHFICNAAYRGFQLSPNGYLKTILPANSYGSGYQTPENLDGTFFMQFGGGLKYYVGREKKKRDF